MKFAQVVNNQTDCPSKLPKRARIMNLWKLLLYKIDAMEVKILPFLDGNAVMAIHFGGP